MLLATLSLSISVARSLAKMISVAWISIVAKFLRRQQRFREGTPNSPYKNMRGLSRAINNTD
jgi:hypothetical protein